MKNDLTERYINAVTKGLNRKQREDVAQELRGLSEDLLTERCGGCTPSEKDVRVVLTELGDPGELAAQYAEDGKRCLIGQPYFSTYKMVLGVVWVAVAVGMAASSLILMAIGQWTPWEMVGNFLANTIQGLTSAFAFVTLLFAFLERRGIRWNPGLDDLPPVPQKTQEISLWESIAGIVFCVVFLVIFLWMPEVLGFALDDSGKAVSLFDVQSIRNSWPCIAAFGLLGIVGESIKLIERRYTRKVLMVTVVTNFLSAVVAVIWLGQGNLFSWAYNSQIHTILEGNDVAANLLGNFHLFFLGTLLFALAMDTAEAAYRTLKGN